ncbi:MAG TPA: ribosome biogenesis GTPase Der [Candidatus Polarisedimenticolia bacterium]|nr:ribosome biogenesis GTPase Der [Candidatus Polarisedimenticolia bacterium]
MSLPVVAIVGAPNVGKSTLFNRLIGWRKSIVSDHPGVTRDRIMAACDLAGRQAILVDTGGATPGRADPLALGVTGEAIKAVEEADVVVFLVDARAGVTAADEDVAGLLRSSGRPVILGANKIDGFRSEGLEGEAYRLGLGEVVALSAEQGRGLDELVDRIRATLPPPAPHVATAGLPLAIIGRPNVGKSSLFNLLVRDQRALVSPAAGTTRDPIDANFTHAGVLYRIVDTAGIRRRTGGAGEVEWVSVLKARRALLEAEIVIALVDALQGVEHQDQALLGLAAQGHRPLLVAFNKIDLLPAGREELAQRLRRARQVLRFIPHVPLLPISALSGRGIPQLLAALRRLQNEIARRFSTPELNRALQAIVDQRQPPSDGGKEVRFYYLTQAHGTPPRFIVFGNGRRVPAPYRRFMEARLRARLRLSAAPVLLTFRRSRRPR